MTKKEYRRKYYEAHADKIKEHMRFYRKENYDKVKEQYKRYKEAHKDEIKERKERYRKTSKDEIKVYMSIYHKEHSSEIKERIKKYLGAHNILKCAIRRGEIIRGPCAVCGSTKNIHGHHEDYSKPLEVIWLCASHHKEIHKKIN